ncbi:MAG: hypothetical protein C6I00_07310 [Nitratiruptor sp.]|nr:hypothetical protein [Nitratiruptor sp.]NPA83843.1 hypothetical protein [Campylobacterota bacterium]
MRVLFFFLFSISLLFGATASQEYINELRAFLTSRTFTIAGIVYSYDFDRDGRIDYNDWIFQSAKGNRIYRLLGTTPSEQNAFGYAPVAGVNLAGKEPDGFFVFIDFPKDRDKRFSWIYLSLRDGCVYKLMGRTPENLFDYLRFGSKLCDPNLTFIVEDQEVAIVYKNIDLFETILDHEDTPGFSWRLYRHGDQLFVADGSAGLSVFDIVEPDNIELAYRIPLGGHQLYDIAIAGRYAYLANGKGGLYIVDLERRQASACSYLAGREVTRVSLHPSGRHLVAILDEKDLVVLDIKGDKLTNLRRIPTCSNPLDIHFCGNDLLVVDGCDGLILCDMSDPHNPIVKPLYFFIDPRGVTSYQGRYAIATRWEYANQIIIYDTQEGRPVHFDVGDRVHKGVVAGDRLYLLGESSFISIWDLGDDPMHPRFVQKIYLPYPATDLLVDPEECVAYVANGGNGVLVISIP